MTDHVKPRRAPRKTVKPALPKGTAPARIQSPRKVNAPARAPQGPNRGGSLGAVDTGGAPQDFSSRQPGGTYTPRPE